MIGFRFTPSIYLSLSLAGFILLLGLFPSATEELLQFDRTRIAAGEWWRLYTGQLVHYGIYHLLMNLAALLLCGYIFLSNVSLKTYFSLLMVTATFVGLGIYWYNPELSFYAGLSGALHGLIMFGLLSTLKQTPLINTAGVILVVAKIWQEHSASYHATQLQQLLPVPVAVDAHLYGALGGLAFTAVFSAYQLYQRRNTASTKSC